MIRWTLTEFSYLSGRARVIDSADSVGCLDFARCDALNTYAVVRNGTEVAEFEGCDVWTVKAWLVGNAGYDGSLGVHVWRCKCGLCDGSGENENCACSKSIYFAV